MTFPIDEYFLQEVGSWTQPAAYQSHYADVSDHDLQELFAAQVLSRQLDFAARQLQSRGEGFYTIGSAGHESNAAIALALRPSDPALLHYRSGGFYCGRAGQVPGVDAASDIVHSLTCSTGDVISGGRHKVFGSTALSIIPQTSTIASHLPRAVGLAFALGRRTRLGVAGNFPDDAVTIVSLGDASLNHSTAAGALNTAGHLAHQQVPLPLVVLVEDNGIGISVKTPAGWTATVLQSLPGFDYVAVDGADPEHCLSSARQAVEYARSTRRPVAIHLSTVRFLGHAGSDVEHAYRSQREITADYARDPLVATARALWQRRVRTPDGIIAEYHAARQQVAATIDSIMPVERLASSTAVMAPLEHRRPEQVRELAGHRYAADRSDVFRGTLPEDAGPLTLAQSINASLTDLFAAVPEALAFGEDVANKGGVYGVTRGLRKKFGIQRVFDTLLDEQTVLGTALGAALAGFLPIPEIQYLAYLHNAEDQLRGEAATLKFFSQGQYGNGMVVRIAGLSYQKGFGGHYHNDNSLAVLRDIPGLILAVPSSAAEAPRMLRLLTALATAENRVCAFVEPIALYHTRDLFPDDKQWLAPYQPPAVWNTDIAALDAGTLHGKPGGVMIVTFGNGVPMSLRAVATAQHIKQQRGEPTKHIAIYDLRWLAPLPTDHLMTYLNNVDQVLVVDETRRSGGISEGIMAELIDAGYHGTISRVASKNSVIPLGPAADTVLLSEQDIIDALLGGIL